MWSVRFFRWGRYMKNRCLHPYRHTGQDSCSGSPASLLSSWDTHPAWDRGGSLPGRWKPLPEQGREMSTVPSPQSVVLFPRSVLHSTRISTTGPEIQLGIKLDRLHERSKLLFEGRAGHASCRPIGSPAVSKVPDEC